MDIAKKTSFLRRGRFQNLLFLSVLVFCLAVIVALLQAASFSKPSNSNEKQPDNISVSGSTESITGNKMGFADFLKIYHSYSKTKTEDERLKEEGRDFQEKIDTDRNKISELEKKINSAILSQKEKEDLNKEIEELKTKITKDVQEFNLKIDNERKQAIDKLIEDLRTKISNYGKEKGYTMIFDQNALVFSDTHLDLTQEIVDYINKNDK